MERNRGELCSFRKKVLKNIRYPKKEITRSNKVLREKEFDYEIDYEDEEIYQRFIKRNRKKLRRTEPEYLEDTDYQEFLDE